MNLFAIVYLVYSAFIVFTTERIMGVFFERRRTSFVLMLCSYFLYFALTGLTFFFLANPIINLIIYLSLLFMVTLNYESSLIRRGIAVACTYLLFLLADLLVSLIFTVFPVEPFESAGQSYLLAYPTIALLSYSAAILLRSFKNIRKNMITMPMFWVSAFIIPVSSAVLIILAVMHLPQSAAIAVVSIIFTINLFTFYLHDTLSVAFRDKMKALLYEQEKEYYFAQCRMMQESVDRVKAIRHDMQLHLAALKGYTIDNTEAGSYLDRLLGDMRLSEVYSDTGNIAFDSIINFKLRNATDENIKTDVQIFIPPALNIEVADVVTILGNLLDNALEAVEKTEDKHIKLDIAYDKGCLFIKMDNSFSGEVKYTEKMTIGTLKSPDKHGYGLKNIQKSIEKYSGHIDISHEGSIFSVGVLLYL